MSDAKRIRGAVLTAIGEPAPYTESRPIVVEDLELDAPGDGEILVRVEAAGICHSDLSVVNGDRPRPVPMLLGHEAAGIVEQVGPDTGLSVGDRVVMTFLPRCGDCAGCRSNGRFPCAVGSAANNEGTLLGGHRRLHDASGAVNHHLGASAFATHAVVSERSVVKVGDDVPPDVAALFGCALLTGGGAVMNVLKPTADSAVAVVGLGGVGMAALIVAKALGVQRIIGVDAPPAKLDAATALGATEVYTPAQAVEAGVTADGVVEAVGNPRALETAIALTGMGGTTVTVGLPAPGQTIAVDPLALTAQARAIVGCYLGSAVPSVDIKIYEDMWRDGRLDVTPLISSRIRLDQINEAMDSLTDGATTLRQIIEFP
ncbi:alcohol dehydrogenase catalytic domain-containing protein [Gordonia sp. (in: high G+C Gram-positive bacteria)]|uniref:alcohol dehydrogenase catalytic domain-containing protein n=1 Tax=Gordonia sp. (in: high G+C Gram-positive bacteria) TaxID=84139 RepID=UPI0039E521DF